MSRVSTAPMRPALLVCLAFSLASACDRPEPPRPVPIDPRAEAAPTPSASPLPVPSQLDPRPARGAVTPALFTDLPAAEGAPRRGGRTPDAPLAGDYLLGLGPFAVDGGDVWTADRDLGEVILQPRGAWSEARTARPWWCATSSSTARTDQAPPACMAAARQGRRAPPG